MTLEEIESLHKKIARGLESTAKQKKSMGFYAELAGLRDEPPDRQLSYGYSPTSTAFRPELRVYAKKGAAVSVAQQIKADYNETRILRVADYQSDPQAVPDEGIAALTRRKRPLALGVSISHRDGFPGTLGGFVSMENGKLAALSCDHVLSHFATGEAGDPIHQPATKNFGARDKDVFAKFTDGIHPTRNGSNDVDAAIAELMEGVEQDGNVVPGGFGLDYEGQRIIIDNRYTFPVEGTEVEKIGRTTGHTVGTLLGVGMNSVMIERRGLRGRKSEIFEFNKIIEVQWKGKKEFSLPGDSGSLVYYRYFQPDAKKHDSIHALGIVFAGARLEDLETGAPIHVSYVCSIKSVLEKLDCTWE